MRRSSIEVLMAVGVLCVVADRAPAASLQVIGQAGFLGEWELTADLTESTPAGRREYSGPLALKHVGLCSTGAPEEKTGRMRLNLSASSSRLTATVVLQGVECAYSATKSDAYDGVLDCPGQTPVPLALRLGANAAKTDGRAVRPPTQ